MKKYIFGVDIGGTTVKMGLFRNDGVLLEKWEIPTRKENNGKEILPDVAKSILGKIEEKKISEEIEGIGVGVPSAIDKNGVIVGVAANLGWKELDVPGELGCYLKYPIKAANDANVAALGEMWQGGGKGYKNLVFVTLGTGVGGGVIVDGKVVAGIAGGGGELGHIHLKDEETEACGCGNKGCLEQYASATGIVRLAKERLAKGEVSSVLQGKDLSAKEVFDAAKAGDLVAVETMKEFGQYLGKGLSLVGAILNPEAFVIGGGVSKAGEMLFDYVRPYYEEYSIAPGYATKFTLATLGNDAGIYGAAAQLL